MEPKQTGPFLFWTETNEFPADVLPQGEFSANWSGRYLQLVVSDIRVPTHACFPGTCQCMVNIGPTSITIHVFLTEISGA